MITENKEIQKTLNNINRTKNKIITFLVNPVDEKIENTITNGNYRKFVGSLEWNVSTLKNDFTRLESQFVRLGNIICNLLDDQDDDDYHFVYEYDNNEILLNFEAAKKTITYKLLFKNKELVLEKWK